MSSGKMIRIAGLVSVNAFTVGLVIAVVASVNLQISSGHFPIGSGIGGIGSTSTSTGLGGIGGLGGIDHTKLSFSAASHAAAAAFCGPCDHKEACIGSIGSVAQKPSANPKDLVQAAIQTTITHVTAALDFSGSVAANTSGSQKMFMEDCKDLLGFAVDELHTCFSTVGVTDLRSLHDKQAELLNWLSAVISYQHTCIDGIFDSHLKQKIMSNGLTAANQLTSNALAIVSTMSAIFDAFKIPFNVATGGGTARALTGSGRGSFGFNFGGAGGENFGASGTWTAGIGAGGGASKGVSGGGGVSTDASGGGGASSGGSGSGSVDANSGVDRRLLRSKKGNQNPSPNKIVAKDGSGDFKTIGEALASYPKKHEGRYVIYVKAGIYDEYLTVTKDQVNVFIYGDGPRKTIITGRKNFHEAAIGNGFVAKSIGFQNTAGPEGHQAVALRVQSDMSAFYNCRIDGYQDTLYVQTHRQFYRNCVISGTVDFIFGDAAAVIQNSLIIVRKPGKNQKNAVTAQGRVDKHETTGIVIQNCRIVPEQKLFAERLTVPTYLGRPWKQYSRTVIMETTIGDLIQPAGWMEWEGNFALDTLYYAEYANRGVGAATNQRVKWKGYKVITDRNEALQFTPGPFLQGDLWLGNTGAPFFLGFKH
ncbi:Pectinesterase inhibitor domain containing protein [Trema orientale]|uniref:Pectinesterase n=1 Tax=Trema orientale TaxID=63057 RepID=A0A2P5F5L2_TREOI|nr:Pectinesterase inhibitor domain containing protein [Trema orientale]